MIYCTLSLASCFMLLYIALWYDMVWHDTSTHPSLIGFPCSQAKNHTLSLRAPRGLVQPTDPASPHTPPPPSHHASFLSILQTKPYPYIPQELCTGFFLPQMRLSLTSQPLCHSCQTPALAPKPFPEPQSSARSIMSSAQGAVLLSSKAPQHGACAFSSR